MTATDQQILNAAKDALLQTLVEETQSWSEGQRQQQKLRIDHLEDVIDKYEKKIARSSGSQIFAGIRRVNL